MRTTMDFIEEDAMDFLTRMQDNEDYVVESPEGQAAEVQCAFLLSLLNRIAEELKYIREEIEELK